MDARITREETALLMNLGPGRSAMEAEAMRLEAIRARDVAIGQGIRRAVVGFGKGVAALVGFVTTYPKRRAVFDQLNALSERELADIGLNRSDLAHVFDEDFAASREAAHRASMRRAATPHGSLAHAR